MTIFTVTSNTELVNTELGLLRKNTGLGSCEPLVTIFDFHQSLIENLVLSVFLFRDTLSNIVYSLTLNLRSMAR